MGGQTRLTTLGHEKKFEFYPKGRGKLIRFFSKEVGKPDLLFWKHEAQSVQMMDWKRETGNQERFCKTLECFIAHGQSFKTTSMEKAS